MQDFVDYAEKEYNLDLETYTTDMAAGLNLFLQTNPNSKAILMGTRLNGVTRRDDPYSANLVPFLQTDGNWPKIMRVHPILAWNYNG